MGYPDIFLSIYNIEKLQGEVSIILCLFYVMIITSLKNLTDLLSLNFDKCLEECTYASALQDKSVFKLAIIIGQ